MAVKATLHPRKPKKNAHIGVDFAQGDDHTAAYASAYKYSPFPKAKVARSVSQGIHPPMYLNAEDRSLVFQLGNSITSNIMLRENLMVGFNPTQIYDHTHEHEVGSIHTPDALQDMSLPDLYVAKGQILDEVANKIGTSFLLTAHTKPLISAVRCLIRMMEEQAAASPTNAMWGIPYTAAQFKLMWEAPATAVNYVNKFYQSVPVNNYVNNLPTHSHFLCAPDLVGEILSWLYHTDQNGNITKESDVDLEKMVAALGTLVKGTLTHYMEGVYSKTYISFNARGCMDQALFSLAIILCNMCWRLGSGTLTNILAALLPLSNAVQLHRIVYGNESEYSPTLLDTVNEEMVTTVIQMRCKPKAFVENIWKLIRLPIMSWVRPEVNWFDSFESVALVVDSSTCSYLFATAESHLDLMDVAKVGTSPAATYSMGDQPTKQMVNKHVYKRHYFTPYIFLPLENDVDYSTLRNMYHYFHDGIVDLRAHNAQFPHDWYTGTLDGQPFYYDDTKKPQGEPTPEYSKSMDYPSGAEPLTSETLYHKKGSSPVLLSKKATIEVQDAEGNFIPVGTLTGTFKGE